MRKAGKGDQDIMKSYIIDVVERTSNCKKLQKEKDATKMYFFKHLNNLANVPAHNLRSSHTIYRFQQKLIVLLIVGQKNNVFIVFNSNKGKTKTFKD